MRLINETNGPQRLKEIEAEEDREARAGDNPPFVQFRRTAIEPFRRLMLRSNAAARVLLCLAERMHTNSRIEYSLQALMQDTGASRSTIHAALTLLEREKWIERVGQDRPCYRVNSNVFWAASGLMRAGSFKPDLAFPKKARLAPGSPRVSTVVTARVSVKSGP